MLTGFAPTPAGLLIGGTEFLKMKNRKAAIRYGSTAVALGGAASLAHAAVDTTEIVSAIAAAGVAAAAVGAAVLVMHVGIKVYKWIRGAM